MLDSEGFLSSVCFWFSLGGGTWQSLSWGPQLGGSSLPVLTEPGDCRSVGGSLYSSQQGCHWGGMGWALLWGGFGDFLGWASDHFFFWCVMVFVEEWPCKNFFVTVSTLRRGREIWMIVFLKILKNTFSSPSLSSKQLTILDWLDWSI